MTWPQSTSAPAEAHGGDGRTVTYDGTDDRVLKTAVDAQGNQLHTAYIFDSLELRRATFDGTNYARNVWTEVPYLFAHGVRLARVHYATNDVPTLSSGQLHVLLELPDHLGSSAIVIDRDSSELVERSTYQAYGGAESDYRPERWDSYREDYRFTGKEEDVEVGVQYFGKRYYAPLLGRWVSADPLAVHTFHADPNLYAYVHGAALRTIDPLGLAPPGQAQADFMQQAENLGLSGATEGYSSQDLEVGKKPSIPANPPTRATVQATSTPQKSSASTGSSSIVRGIATGAGKGFASVAMGSAVEDGIVSQTIANSIGVETPGLEKMNEANADLAFHLAPKNWMEAVGTALVAAGGGYVMGRGAFDHEENPIGKSALQNQPAPLPSNNEGYILRGVSARHPAVDAARAGIVIPGKLNGNVSPEAHNIGNASASSAFTSWTHDPEIARFHALKDGPGGLILRVPKGAPPPGAAWSWEWSPDEYGESEVLMQGVRSGVDVFSPK